MKIVADRSKCLGAGQCVMVAPDLFSQAEDDGLVVMKKVKLSAAEISAAELAVRSCPTQAISLEADVPAR
jgi:ferredoxin